MNDPCLRERTYTRTPAQLPSSETGECCLVSGNTSLQMPEGPLNPWFLPDSSGCRHGVAGCIVLLQSLGVLFSCARHTMLVGMSLLSLLSQSRLAQVLAPNHSLAASHPVFSVPPSLCGDHQTSPVCGLHHISLATSSVSATRIKSLDPKITTNLD